MSYTKPISAFTAIVLVCFGTTGRSDPVNVSTYGTPGLVELPTAYMLDEGSLSFGVSLSGITLRNTATFQILPWLQGSFRYAITEDFGSQLDTRYDRSFDINAQLLQETDTFPAIAIGLRDFVGTGVLSSEYIVATKQISNDLSFTGGIGWGRLAGRNSFDNPLSILGLNSDTRDNVTTGFGGQVESGRWFQGQASLFGGLEWKVSDDIRLQLEYSPDQYITEAEFSDLRINSPVNAALTYNYSDKISAKAYTIGGSQFGVQFALMFDAKNRAIPGGREPAPTPITPRPRNGAALYANDATALSGTLLENELAGEGITLHSFQTENTTSIVNITNNRWDVEAQAAGRTARSMARALPPEIESFTVIFQERGVPVSSITTKRRDLEELEYDYDASWRTLARAQIADASQPGKAGPALSYDLGPYTAFSFFDPSSPIRADFGVQLGISYQTTPGLTFDAQFRYPLAGNLDGSDRESDSTIPRVRSESNRYAQESDFEVNRLTTEYLWRPAPETFARVTAGYLENQYGGLSAEMLWTPIESRFAFGAELNYVKQRDFDMLLGFQEYDVVTGHASAYYDLGNGFHTQVDLGRYLAGDWGGTLTVKREFNNGVKVGGYFTLTDVPFDDFGEGSFDKGLSLEIPLSFFTGRPSRRVLSQNIQPLLRDGGARLHVQNRLYPLVRDYRGPELRDGWARYLR